MLNIGTVLYFKENEPVNDQGFVNYSLKDKLTSLLTPWEIRNFLFWVVSDGKNTNKLSVVVQSIYMDNFPTLTFHIEDSNVNYSVAELTKQFRTHIANVKSLDFDDKNVIINRWWKNYLSVLPKKPMLPEFKEATFAKEIK